MLHAMQENKAEHPMALNVKDWYGMATNYNFAAAYETGYNYINREGKVEFGPANSGYRDYLALLNRWYKDGLIDPDFGTRAYEDYNANILNGLHGAFGLAYGEMGQIKLSGTQLDPKFKLKPLIQPVASAGQTIHLRQDNGIVRSDKSNMTVKAVDDGVDEIVVKFIDYWYSQDGGDLCTRGPEGLSYKWNAEGTYDWIYPDLVNNPDSDFWTLYPRFKLHNDPHLRDSTAYENEPEVEECINYWATQDASWVMPEGITPTPDEAKELADLEADINTYREEMTLKFITGQTPLSDFDSFVNQLKTLGIDRAVEIKQACLDRYFRR
jgi:putative aldouronate transport system substrate-binding protein